MAIPQPNLPPFPLLGLSGGIAAGKTHVAGLLAARGWAVIDADGLAREAVAPGTAGLREVAAFEARPSSRRMAAWTECGCLFAGASFVWTLLPGPG